MYEADEENEEILLDPEPLREEATYDEWAENLVPEFARTEKGRKALRTIADLVRNDFKTGSDAMKKRRDKDAENWSLFEGALKEKTHPFENCANPHVPLMAENILRLFTQTHKEIFGDWTNVCAFMPLGAPDANILDAMWLHTNWQLREGIKDFQRQIGSRALLYFLVNGDVVTESSWDPVLKMNRHEALTRDDYVVPYTHVSTMADLSDIPYICRIKRKDRYELEEMQGRWHGVIKFLNKTASGLGEERPEIEEAVSELKLVEVPSGARVDYKIVEWYGWLKLPGQKKRRWCKVVFPSEGDETTLFLLNIHEEEDWHDKRRFEKEMGERDEYRAAVGSYEAARSEYDAGQQAIRDVVAVTDMDLDARSEFAATAIEMPEPTPPEAPGWLDDPNDVEGYPEPPRTVPIRMFAHGVCFESPAGIIGFGVGDQQANHNKAVNTMFSQFIDASTLANGSGFLALDSLQLVDGPRLKVGPGIINRVRNVSDLNKAMVPIPVSPGNQDLLTGVQLMHDWSQTSIQAPDVLSGESGKSGETYRGISARIEQANKQMSVIAGFFANGPLRQVLINNAILNARFLPEYELNMIFDKRIGQTVSVPVSREMYDRGYDVEIRADMRFVTQEQKVNDAMKLLTLPQQVPEMMANSAFRYAATVEFLKAMGKEAMIPLLGSAPPSPPAFMMPPPPPPEGGMEGGPGGGPPGAL